MRNIKLVIEYDGGDYCGWQIQNSSKPKKHRTIQGEIEKALKRILQGGVRVIGSSRTDAGVHAETQVAHFKTKTKLPVSNIQAALNTYLPKDIVIKRAEDVDLSFHSRFDAEYRQYRYVILNRNYRSALNKRCYFVPYKLDFDSMKKEINCLKGRRNFSSFKASDKKERNPIREIYEISLNRRGDYIILNIVADSFLYNMVRNIIGTLIEIGRGKFPPGSMRRILTARDRRKAGPTAHACGLTLVKVRY